jgi:hypothetical protein
MYEFVTHRYVSCEFTANPGTRFKPQCFVDIRQSVHKVYLWNHFMSLDEISYCSIIYYDASLATPMYLWFSVHISDLRHHVFPTQLKLSLCLTKHHAMKTYWGRGSIAPRVLNRGSRWRRVFSSMLRPLYSPALIDRGTHWRGGWVGPRARLDAVAKRKNPYPFRNLTPVVNPVA